MMFFQARFLTACIVLATGFMASCAPAPKWNAEAEAKPFLQEMTFAEQKSIKVLLFGSWSDGGSTLIFTTDKVDFNDSFVTRLDFERYSGPDLVAAIECLCEYRFTKPATKSTQVYGTFPGNVKKPIDVVKDGDHYVCYVVVLKPKADDLPAVPSKK